MKGLAGSTLPFNYTVYMVAACNIPYISNYVPLWVELVQQELPIPSTLAFGLRLFMDWAIFGLMGVFAIGVSLPLFRLGRSLQGYNCFQSRWRAVAVVVPVVLFLVCLLWLPFAISTALTEKTSLLPLAPFLGIAAITFRLFFRFPCGPGQGKKRGQASRKGPELSPEEEDATVFEI